MKRNISGAIAGLALVMLLGLPAEKIWAIPSDLTISGQLLDENGFPILFYGDGSNTETAHMQIEKQLESRLVFFDGEFSSNSVETISTTAKVYDGYFTIVFRPTQELISLDEVYYELAIDVHDDGITLEDFFDGRFQMASVPFALSGVPADYYSVVQLASDAYTIQQNAKSALGIAPFITPAGGIRFDRVNTWIHTLFANASFSIGIYNESGELIVSTPVVSSNSNSIQGYLEMDVEKTRLKPSTLYFVGISVDGTGNEMGWLMQPLQVVVPSIPLVGWVDGVASGASVPQEFSVENIVPGMNKIRVPAVTLSLQNSPHSKALGTALKKVTVIEGDGYRWIAPRMGD